MTISNLKFGGVDLEILGFGSIKGEEIKRSKPAMGIMPEWVWIERRNSELKDAIDRYMRADCQVPLEWIVEMNKHCNEFQAKGYVKGGHVVTEIDGIEEFESLRELKTYLDKLSDEILDKELRNDGYRDCLSLFEDSDGKTVYYM